VRGLRFFESYSPCDKADISVQGRIVTGFVKMYEFDVVIVEDESGGM
jgi:hypothetical protein